MNTVGLSDERVPPVQRLHPEILAEIFKFCLSTNDWGIDHAPLLLCNVCSSWRALAISTPLLWTDLNLNLRFKSLVDSNMQAVVDGIHTWLGRSGILSLTIRLYSESEEHFDQVLHVWDALSTYASRWKNVDVAVPSSDFSSWPNLRAVPLLLTLRIRFPFDEIPFTSAPCLARVHLFSAPSTVIPHIPWHQLVELAISEWQSDDSVLQLVSWCPLLDSIDVRIASFPPFFVSGPVRIPPVEHATLRNIRICFVYNNYTILESLVVPGLKSLSLCDDTLIENRNWSRIHSNPLGLMNMSHCDLRELHLVRCCFNQLGLIEYLEHRSCRKLTSLRIENYGRSQNVFDELLLRLTHVDAKTEDSLCPELTHLTLTYCQPGNTTAGVLGRMILSRSRKTERNRLGTFGLFIDASCELAETDQVLLKRAEENGLKLCINKGIWWRCMCWNATITPRRPKNAFTPPTRVAFVIPALPMRI